VSILTDTPTGLRPATILDEPPGETDETWYCVSTDPWPCPADGCDFIANHLTAAHKILVWPENDDPDLLYHAHRARLAFRNPRVIEFEISMGPFISYAQWSASGRGVHGVSGDRPDNYPGPRS
jgi:hypothetical protein